jgi:hypothetical protein
MHDALQSESVGGVGCAVLLAAVDRKIALAPTPAAPKRGELVEELTDLVPGIGLAFVPSSPQFPSFGVLLTVLAVASLLARVRAVGVAILAV